MQGVYYRVLAQKMQKQSLGEYSRCRTFHPNFRLFCHFLPIFSLFERSKWLVAHQY